MSLLEQSLPLKLLEKETEFW